MWLSGFVLYLLQSHFVKRHELEEVQHNMVISIYELMVGLHCVHSVLLAPQELSIPKPSREATLLSSASRFMKQQQCCALGYFAILEIIPRKGPTLNKTVQSEDA